jgi:glutathione S-transferase
MSLKLYMHPLSSYCHKALIAFYENEIPFEIKRVDEPSVSRELKELWPVARFPVLHDEAREEVIPEASIIIEYLAQHYPGKLKLIPEDPERARQVRLRDRFYDNYMHAALQKYALNGMRPRDKRDPLGIDEALAMFRTTLEMVEVQMAGRTWAAGEEFTMADCAAAPPLFYGNLLLVSFRDTHPTAAAYLDRLMRRPSYARALEEARPYMHLLPHPAFADRASGAVSGD